MCVGKKRLLSNSLSKRTRIIQAVPDFAILKVLGREQSFQSVKQLGLRLAPLNLRPLSSAGKGWIAPSKGIEVSRDGVHGGGKNGAGD